jgi:hypothetical protein
MKNQNAEAPIRSEGSLPEQFNGEFSGHDMGEIFIRTKAVGDINVLDVRGWGYLMGQGALGMSDDEGDTAQVQFERWIIKTLNDALEK